MHTFGLEYSQQMFRLLQFVFEQINVTLAEVESEEAAEERLAARGRARQRALLRRRPGS